MKPGQKIYKLFEQITDGLEEQFEGIRHPSAMLKYGYEDLMKIKEARKRYEQQRLFKRLEEQQYLKIVKKGQKVFCRITDKGWKTKLRNAILNKKTKLRSGQVCIISFDIPETARSVRDAIRLLLAESDFKQIHRSVWAGERDVVKELERFVKALKADDWIHIFIGKQII